MSIKGILMKRDNLSSDEADDLIREAKSELDRLLSEGKTEQAYDICQDYFGLEPDYLEELL